MEFNKKKTLIISISSIAMFIILVVASSFAFFTTSIKKENPENSTVDVSTAKITATFTDGAEINVTNAIPGDTFDKTFTLKNTGNIKNTFTNKNDVEVIVKENGTPIKTTIFPSTTGAISDEITIGPDVTKSYTVTITYKNTETDQSSDMNSKVKGKIFIEEV